MPTYEYACKSCGEHLEVVQSFEDAALTECPACGGSLRKVFQPIGIAFKGSGFYKNDSRASATSSSSSSSSKGGDDKSADGSKAASSDGKSSSEAKGSGSDGSSSPSTSSTKSNSAAAS